MLCQLSPFPRNNLICGTCTAGADDAMGVEGEAAAQGAADTASTADALAALVGEAAQWRAYLTLDRAYADWAVQYEAVRVGGGEGFEGFGGGGWDRGGGGLAGRLWRLACQWAEVARQGCEWVPRCAPCWLMQMCHACVSAGNYRNVLAGPRRPLPSSACLLSLLQATSLPSTLLRESGSTLSCTAFDCAVCRWVVVRRPRVWRHSCVRVLQGCWPTSRSTW